MIGGHYLHLSAAPPTSAGFRRHPPLICKLTKQGERFLSTVTTAEEPSAAVGLLRKFVASSSKHVAISTLSHLLSHPRLSSLAFPMYSVMKQESWFCWNAKIVADLIALLYKDERFDEADELFAETVAKLGFKERDVCVFYRNLIDSHGKHKSERGVLDCFTQLQQLISQSSSIYVKQKGYESMVAGFCEMGFPDKAEDLIEEMRESGLKPSGFEFKSLIYGYGQKGFLQDMKRIVLRMENEGFELDTVCYNMVLSSFGAHNELVEMRSWLNKMRDSGICSSIRTYNSVLNYCPTIMLLQQDMKNVPLSIDELVGVLPTDETDLVKELLKSSILDQVMERSCSELKLDLHGMHSGSCSELKLDLHGMHSGSAYLVLLQWFSESKKMFAADGNSAIPAEILVVCGCGKHSSTRGESPVKDLAKEMITRMKCPLRIDRKNIGCFIGKGKKYRDWLNLE